MGTPYSKNEWDIDIIRVNGSYIFNIRHLKSSADQDIQFDKFTYYGYAPKLFPRRLSRGGFTLTIALKL